MSVQEVKHLIATFEMLEAVRAERGVTRDSREKNYLRCVKNNQEECIVCGRAVKNYLPSTHYVDLGNDDGYQIVGSDCAKTVAAHGILVVVGYGNAVHE